MKHHLSLPLSITILITIALLSLHHLTVAEGYKNETKHYCLDRCGDIEIQPPFGIGTKCSYNESFSVTCTHSSSSSSSPHAVVPVLEKLSLEIIRIQEGGNDTTTNWFGTVTVKVPSVTACQGSNGSGIVNAWWTSPNFTDSGFLVDQDNNVFASLGCNGYAALYNETGGFTAGCSSVCGPNPGLYNETQCEGYRCCQIELPNTSNSLLGVFTIGASSVNNGSGMNCTSAFLISRDYLQTKYASLVASSVPIAFAPVELGWSILKFHSKKKHRVDASGVLVALLYYVLPSAGTLLLTCLGFWLCWLHKTKRRRKEVKLRAKYFKKRLEERTTTTDKEVVEKTKLFTIKELKIATNNFSQDRILGKGGQGTVYKGILMNGQVVAIKRSTTWNDIHWKEFINEVILLSQIKHKHIVKLHGCCLETNELLIVYEFIPNGTLSEHICNSVKGLSFPWEARLRIAAEVANALSYLHSECPTAIYHRDIKSSNILLDHSYMAKVSDFGISKAMSSGETHLTTRVQGTFGYLDPEYFRSSQFSEKSDVYSFGVVLVELLTGQKAIRSPSVEENGGGGEEISLVEYFVSSMNNSSLHAILDPAVRLLEDNRREEIVSVANLAKQCLNLRGALRPTMKEVASVLEGLRHPQSSCIIPIDESGITMTPMEASSSFYRAILVSVDWYSVRSSLVLLCPALLW